MKSDNKMQIVVQEILEDKIFLDSQMNLQIAAGAEPGTPAELDFRSL
jgi:hypothetical protein